MAHITTQQPGTVQARLRTGATQAAQAAGARAASLADQATRSIAAVTRIRWHRYPAHAATQAATLASRLWTWLQAQSPAPRDPGPLAPRSSTAHSRAPAPAIAPAPPPPLLTWRAVPGIALLCLVSGLGTVWTLSRPTDIEAAPPNHTLRAEIQEDGPALFYAVHDDRRVRVWTVHCRTPLRGCVARAPGLALRLDDQHRPWIIAPVGPNARLSVQEGPQTRDLPRLLSRPLQPDAVDRLSRPKARLLIEDGGRITGAIQTEGLDEVVSYLSWLKSDKGRTLRDARLWPRGEVLSADKLTSPQLERFEAQQRYIENNKPQTVPRTKPQIESAIRAQGGGSFFDAQGNWVP